MTSSILHNIPALVNERTQMKRTVAYILLLWAVVWAVRCGVQGLSSEDAKASSAGAEDAASADKPAAEAAAAAPVFTEHMGFASLGLPSLPPRQEESAPAESFDEEASVNLLLEGEVVCITLRDYLIGVVAAEMPASFAPEALKAQAIAARSCTLYNSLHPGGAHPQAEVCGDSGCCQAYATESRLREKWGGDYDAHYEAVAQAVDATDGLCLFYDGQLIYAPYHASSFVRTENSGQIWSEKPYLVSVSSPETEETVDGLVSSVRIYKDDFIAAVAEEYPSVTFPDGLSVGAVSYTPSGRVDSIEINGTAVSAVSLRRLLGLRSTTFQMVIDGDEVVITVYGYGHGVGMSQHGANLMAKDGCGCEDILCHYYSGVEIRQLSSAEEE